MSRLPISSVLIAAALALAFLMTRLVGTPWDSAGAVSGQVDFVGIDMEVGATPANTATSLGSVETCNDLTSLAIDGTLSIDVTVDSIDPADASKGFQFALGYDPAVVKVTAKNNLLLMASGGGTIPIDFSEGVPDTDGTFAVALTTAGS